MSIHSSLRVGDNLKGERSVFTRIERIAVLKKAGKFNEETGEVYGLPKVRTRFKSAVKKPKAEAAAPAAGSVAGAVAAPAAGAKGAAPAAAGAKGAAPAAGAKGAAPAAADKKGGEKKK